MAQKRKRQGPAALPRGLKPLPKELALRTVRPRPLHYEEKLRVLWPGDPELQKVDGGSFEKWLRETEEARENGDLKAVGSCQAQVVIVGNSSDPAKALKKAAERQPSASSVPVGTSSMLAERLGGKTIAVPAFCQLSKQEMPAEPSVDHQEEGNREEAAYIRHRDQTLDEADLKVEYDLDSEDEQWLSKRNKKSAADQLTEDDLEQLIDAFEKAKHAHLEQKHADWSKKGSSSLAVPPEDRAPAEIYPASKAIQDLGRKFPSLTIRAVHNHWAKKAAASTLPLLQRFWYDKPWAWALARSNREEAESDSESDNVVPFQGKDSAPRPSLRGRARLLDLDEIEDRLHIARQDLESLRTIADQVRKREKFKKRQLVEWRQEWRLKIALARIKKKKKAQNKTDKAAAKAKVGGLKKAATKAKKAPTKMPAQVEGASRKQPHSPASGSRSIGGGIVSAVVDQLRRLGSWGSPRGGSQQLPASELGLTPDQLHKASKAAPVSPPAPMTRRQEQAAMNAAIELSLQEHKKAGKKVRFAEAQSPRKGNAGKAEETKGRSDDTSTDGRTRARKLEGTILSRSEKCCGAERDERVGSEPRVPVGFVRTTVPSTRGKLRVPVHWTATCKHGSSALTKLTDLVPFFGEHGNCRPSWRRFRRQADETAVRYRNRLKAEFPLSVPRAAPKDVPSPARKVDRSKRAAPVRKSPAKVVIAAGQKPTRQLSKKAAGEGKQAGKAPELLSTATCAKARRRHSDGAGDSTTEAAFRRMPGKQQQSARQRAAEEQTEEAERTPVRRLTRSTGNKEQAKGKVVRQPESRLNESGGHTAEAPDVAAIAEDAPSTSFSSSGSDTYISPASGAEDSGTAGHEATTQLPPSRRRDGVRVTRRNSGIVDRLVLPKVPLEWQGRAACESASDESSSSEGSGPSFFRQPGDTGATSKRRQVRVGRKLGVTQPKTKGHLVAAARQRACSAAGRR